MASEFGPLSLSTSDMSLDRPALTSTKRRRRSTIRIVCNACRIKKTRCDGRRPVCGKCASHSNAYCIYDTESADETRTAALKQKNEILKRNLEQAERLLEDLRSLPNQESIDLLKRMRSASNSSGSLGPIPTHGYAKPLSSATNTPNSGIMRNIQPMLDGVNLAT